MSSQQGDDVTEVATQPEVDTFFLAAAESPKASEDDKAKAEDEAQASEAKSSKPTCNRCQQPSDDVKSGRCKPCNALRTLLPKHFGKEWPLPEFEKLSEEEQVTFWRDASKCRDGNGRFSYEKIKTTLTTRLTHSRIERQCLSEGGAYKPLSVHAAEGFNVAQVEKNCPKRWNENLKEWCFLVELISVNKDTVFEQVSQEISEIERRVRKRKQAEEAQPDDTITLLSEDESQEAAEPEDGLTQADIEGLKLSKAKKAEKKKLQAEKSAKRKAEKAIAKEEAKQQKDTVILMNKFYGPLNQLLAGLEKLEKKKDNLSPCQQSFLEEELTTIKAWRSVVMQNMAKYAKDQGSKLQPLPFDKASFSIKQKDCKELMSSKRKATKGGA